MTRYYPSITQLKQLMQAKAAQRLPQASTLAPHLTEYQYIRPGYLIRSMQFTCQQQDDLMHQLTLRHDATTQTFLTRLASIADLTPKLYQRFQQNPDTMSYWYPALHTAWEKSNHFFKIPSTQIVTLPIELSQYMRLDYSTVSATSHQLFNQILHQLFNLNDQQTYFIKTGTFSSKFEFKNAHLTEPQDIGSYFQVINNFAMMVGAGVTNDVVVRDWIPDPDHHDTIYDGLPLRTEFRAFVDADRHYLIDIVPYWNPLVMKHVLATQGQHNPEIQQDYETYLRNQQRLVDEFNQAQAVLHQQLQNLLPHLKLHGCWSLDIMQSGQTFYLIDMATMQHSALTDLIAPHQQRAYQQLIHQKKEHH